MRATAAAMAIGTVARYQTVAATISGRGPASTLPPPPSPCSQHHLRPAIRLHDVMTSVTRRPSGARIQPSRNSPAPNNMVHDTIFGSDPALPELACTPRVTRVTRVTPHPRHPRHPRHTPPASPASPASHPTRATRVTRVIPQQWHGRPALASPLWPAALAAARLMLPADRPLVPTRAICIQDRR